MDTQSSLYQIADELRAIASLGLRFTDGLYDKERYEKILHASARMVAALEEGSAEEISTRFFENLYHVSPIACVDAAVFREGKLLLIQRKDNGLWAMPGGLAEVGETPVEAVERELWEEAGVHGRVTRLLGVFDSSRWYPKTRMQLYILLFELETEDNPHLHASGDQPVGPLNESLDVGFFAEDQLPPMHPGHDLRIPSVFKMMRGETPVPYFDR
jgi:ADP-ribose pyrophosphatase YjhB (NUDIX family)